MRTKFKKLTSVCLALIMLLSVLTIAPFTAGAIETESASVGDTYTSGDYEYEKLYYDDTVKIINYTGSATVLEIPSEIDGYTVESIGSDAFWGCKCLESVTISDSVAYINDRAFALCSSLKSVTIGKNVEFIFDFAFYDCTSLKNITISDNVTYIGRSAFGYNYDYYADTRTVGFTIYGYTGSGAETYAIKNGFDFISLGQATILAETPAFSAPGGDSYISTLDNIYEDGGLFVEFYSCDEFGNIENLLGSCQLSRYLNGDNSGWYYQGYCRNIDIKKGCVSVVKDSDGEEISFNDRSWGSSSGSSTISNYVNIGVCPASANITYTIERYEESDYYGAETDYDVLTYYIFDVSRFEINNFVYDGTPKLPEVKFIGYDSVYFEGKKDYILENGKDYTLTYSNNINAGTATVTVTGKGIYTGTVTKTFVINKAGQELIADIESKTLNCGEKSQIFAMGEGNIIYTSSDESVVTVSNTGVVTAVGEGQAVITVEALGNSNYNPDTTKIIVFVSASHNILGDVNSDGKISIDDVTDIQKHLANMVEFTKEQVSLADVDKNGTVSIDDVTLIQKHLAGIAVIE